MDTKTQGTMFENNWKKYRDNSEYAVFKALAKTYWREFTLAMLLNFIHAIIQIGTPINIGLIVSYMESPEGEDGGKIYGAILVGSYILFNLLEKLIDEQSSFQQNLIGLKSHAAMVSIIYKKCLRISSATNKEFSKGEIVNFIQVDAERLGEVAFLFPGVSRLPFQLIFTIAYLIYYFGYFVLIPVGVGIIVIVLMYVLSLINAYLQTKWLAAKDGRMNNFTEAINSIKIVKLMSWKRIFAEKILNFRNQELKYIRLTLLTGAIEIFLIFLSLPMMRTTMFMFFMLSGKTIELSHAFVAITVIWSLFDPIQWIPQFIGVFIEFMVSMRRIQKVSLNPI